MFEYFSSFIYDSHHDDEQTPFLQSDYFNNDLNQSYQAIDNFIFDVKNNLNLSENTESSTEKNQQKNLSEKTESSTKKKQSTIFECVKQERLLGKKRTNGFAEIKKKPKKDNSKSGSREDNIIKKFITEFLNDILILLNNSMGEPNKKSLYKINRTFIHEPKADFMKKFLYMKLKEFFSNDISRKGKILGKDYNKKIIEEIGIENTNIKTINILEKTFLECLEHFRGTKKCCEELIVLEDKYKEFINNLKKHEKKDEK